MTLTIELPPGAEAVLLQEAQQQGVPIEQYVTEMIADILQDREDMAEMDRRLATADKSQYRTLDELRAVIQGQPKPEQPTP